MNTTKIAIGAALVGAFALGVTVVGFSSARQDAKPSTHSSEQVSTSFSELQENEIRDIVRAYLLENPEVIIEAVNEYSARQQLAEVERTRVVAEQNLAALLDANTGFVAAKDQSKAKVAVVELYDYHCGFCKRATPIINDMVNKDSDIKVVLRELPILREESEYAAEMSLAARDQGKFLEYHNALMEAPGVLSKERVQDIARDLDLDVAQMEAAIGKGDIANAIETNHEIAAQMGEIGTPTFIVATLDGSYVDVVIGFRPDELQDKIAEAKKSAG